MDHQHLQEGLNDLRPEDRLTATVVPWHEPQTRKGGFTLNACSYGIVIRSNYHAIWTMGGAGYSPNPIPPVVSGIRSLLQALPQGRRLEVHAHEELERYIEYDGFGRNAMDRRGKTKQGKPLGCYPAIADIIKAYDARLWSLHPYKDKEEMPGYWEAYRVATGKAKSLALQHKADFSPTLADYPRPIILQEYADEWIS